jgi:probable rRNA maturation factor
MRDKTKIEFSNRQKALKADKELRNLLRACCLQTLRQEKVDFPCLVSVSLVEEEEIRALNAEGRGVDRVTDVLSFPLEEFRQGVPAGFAPLVVPLPLGDIVLCTAQAMRQAEEYGHGLRRELAFLTVHSMLHLLGYDHMESEEERQMIAKQEQVLKSLSITREPKERA